MTVTVPLTRLQDVALFNPSLDNSPELDEIVSFLPMSSVDADLIDAIDIDTRRYEEVNKGYTPFIADDVLVAKITPCFENGKIVQAKPTRRIGFGSTEFHIVRPIKNKLDSRYLVHFLRQEYIREEGRRKMTGSAGQRRVPAYFLANLKIPLPSLTEQQRIADILDKADALRAKRRATLALLDTLTQSIFLEMFGDPIINPRGWPKRKLNTLGSLDRGVSKHRPRNAPELLGGPYPFVQTGDIANSGGYITNFSSTYSEIGLKQSKIWPAGTLCITIAANIAKTGILTFDACFPDSVVGFRSQEPGMVEFIRFWLSFLQSSLEERAPESAQKNINLEILRGLDVPTPDKSLRLNFMKRLMEIESMKTLNQKALSEQDVLFSTLQNRAFKGEL